MKQFLAPRQSVQFTAIGEYLYIHTAPDKIRICTHRGEYTLTERAQIKDADLSGLITVENLSDEGGIVEISYGFGEYIPPNDGQAVTVTTMPEVVVKSMPNTVVESLPPVVVEAIPNVIVETMPSVTVESLPSVKLESGQAVRIYATSPVLSKPVGGTSIQTNTLTVVDGVCVLAANSSRCHVVVKVPDTNSAPVMLGDYPLFAGDKETINTFGELAFSGSDGDQIHIIEVLR